LKKEVIPIRFFVVSKLSVGNPIINLGGR